MINESNAHKYCRDDISKIENYDKAIADNSQLWDCHHRDEVKVLPSGMTVLRSRQDLIDNGRYYNCPANELIFLTHSEHQRVHNKFVHISDETRKKLSEVRKGKKHTEYAKKKMSEAAKGRVFSEEHRLNLSKALKGKHLSEEHRMKLSESFKGISRSDDIKKAISKSCIGRKLIIEPDGKKHWYKEEREGD